MLLHDLRWSASIDRPLDGCSRQQTVSHTRAGQAGRQQRRLMKVYPRVGEHLVGHQAAAGRVGEVREPVAAQAAGERHERGDLTWTMRFVLAWRPAVRQQVVAGRVCRAERWRLRVARHRIFERAARCKCRVGHVHHAVRAQALDEPDRVLLTLLQLGVGRVAAGARRAGAACRDRRAGKQGGRRGAGDALGAM